MSASYKTLDKAVSILRDFLSDNARMTLLQRLLDETVPSGNTSYDATIRRLAAMCGVKS
jgi:hypothetical protein